jgi:hypothetical protein
LQTSEGDFKRPKTAVPPVLGASGVAVAAASVGVSKAGGLSDAVQFTLERTDSEGAALKTQSSMVDVIGVERSSSASVELETR